MKETESVFVTQVVDGKTRYESLFDTTLHMPTGRTEFVNEAVTVVGGKYVIVGEIYRVFLDHTRRLDWNNVEIPNVLKMAIKNNKGRRRYQAGFNVNSRTTSYSWWVKASSAFISIQQSDYGGGFVIDFLNEHPSHERDQGSVLHAYLRKEFDCYENTLSFGGAKSLSGHISSLSISNRSVANVFLFDKYCESNAYESEMGDTERIMIRRLWENRIMPITTNAHPIIPRDYLYKFSVNT